MKKRIKKSGEIIDVITFSSGTKRSKLDIVNYIDEKGEEVSANLNYYLDLEDADDCTPDYWETMRNEAALRIYAARISNLENTTTNSHKIMETAIREADELIEKLKEKT